MAYNKIDALYDALKADGSVSKDRNNFRNYMLGNGNLQQGYKNRLELYKALKADGAIEANTYEDFSKELFGGAKQSTPSAPAYSSPKEQGQTMANAYGGWSRTHGIGMDEPKISHNFGEIGKVNAAPLSKQFSDKIDKSLNQTKQRYLDAQKKEDDIIGDITDSAINNAKKQAKADVNNTEEGQRMKSPPLISRNFASNVDLGEDMGDLGISASAAAEKAMDINKVANNVVSSLPSDLIKKYASDPQYLSNKVKNVIADKYAREQAPKSTLDYIVNGGMFDSVLGTLVRSAIKNLSGVETTRGQLQHVVTSYIDRDDRVVGVYPLEPNGFTRDELLSIQPYAHEVCTDDLELAE